MAAKTSQDEFVIEEHEKEPYGRVFNFSGGPATLPLEILQQAKDDMFNWQGSGVSVLEMRYRGPEFTSILNSAEQDCRDLLNIPDNYEVLFLHGGATTQFAAVPFNLLGEKKSADYVETGTWSSKAIQEARKYCDVNLAFSSKESNHTKLEDQSTWSPGNDPAYLYYCHNETVHGIEFPFIPHVPEGVPLVGDFSSCFMSRPIDVSRYGIIFAGAQKNIGPSGVAVAIIRKDLIGNTDPKCPVMLDYQAQAKGGSMHNTPPCYPIYIVGLMFKWLKANGGLEGARKRNIEKANIIYNEIDGSGGFYRCPVDPAVRSLMNIRFQIGAGSGNAVLESKFVEQSVSRGLLELKGHKTLGNLRISIYNGQPVRAVKVLAKFMRWFRKCNIAHL